MVPPGDEAVGHTDGASIMNQNFPRRAALFGSGRQRLLSQLFRSGLPARRNSAHSEPAFERRTASLVSDSGPPESELPKKMRSMGCEAARRFFVYCPGTAMNIGWPRR